MGQNGQVYDKKKNRPAKCKDSEASTSKQAHINHPAKKKKKVIFKFFNRQNIWLEFSCVSIYAVVSMLFTKKHFFNGIILNTIIIFFLNHHIKKKQKTKLKFTRRFKAIFAALYLKYYLKYCMCVLPSSGYISVIYISSLISYPWQCIASPI